MYSPGDIEGIPATQLSIDYPTNLAADTKGNLYVQGGWYIYRANPAGVISLLVGGGLFGYQEGFAGDGGPSVAARLVRDTCSINAAMGMTVDAAGNLYFADSGNDRIRKITNPAGFPAQMAISNPSFNWVPPPQIVTTGGDQWDFNLFPTGPNSLDLTNAGAGAMPWSATVSTLDGANWLNLSADSGSAPSTVVLNANADGLAPGLYMGTVIVSAPDASNSPRYVSGTLQVDPSSFTAGAGSGSLVISEPPGTGWTVTSSADWITITSSASGSGIGRINYAVSANTSATRRTGGLMLNNTTQGTPTFHVNQDAEVGATSGVPSVTNAQPASGHLATQSFTFQFAHSAGYQNLSVLDILINNFLDGRHACFLAYVLSSNTLVLVDDAGDAGGPYAGSVGLGSQLVIQNSQCAVSLTSASGNGNTFTLTLNIAFKTAFGGNKIQYLAARDNAGANTDWQAMGVWQAPPAPTSVITVSGVSQPRIQVVGGTTETVTFTLTDSNGAGDLGVVNVLANNFIDGRQACYLAYAVSSDTLYLVDDGGDAGGPFAGGLPLTGGTAQNIVIQNTQCLISGAGSSSGKNGNTLTLTLAITFQPTFVGNHIVWVAGRDKAGANNTDWQAAGTWSVQ